MLACPTGEKFLGLLPELLHHTLQNIVSWCEPSGFEGSTMNVQAPLIAQHSVGSHSMGHTAGIQHCHATGCLQ